MVLSRSLISRGIEVQPMLGHGAAIFLLAALFSFPVGFVQAQPAEESVDTRIERLESAVSAQTSLTNAARSMLETTIADARAAQRSAAENKSKIESLQRSIAEGPTRIAEQQEQLSNLQDSAAFLSPRLLNSKDVGELEAEIDDLEGQRNGWTQERKRELDASAGASRLDADRRGRLADIASLLQQTYDLDSDEDSSAIEKQIEHLGVEMRRSALQTEEEMLQLALRAAPQVNALRAVRIAWLDASVRNADELIRELQALVADQRGDNTMRQLDELQRIVEPLGGVLSDDVARLVDSNRESIETRQRRAADIEGVRDRITALRVAEEKVTQDASLTRRRLEVAGLEAELGDVMLLRLGSLPSTASLADDRRARNSQIAALSLDTIDTEQAMRELDSSVSSQLGSSAVVHPVVERQVITKLRNMRRELLQAMLQAQNRLVLLLVEANQESTELEALVESYRDLLTANLLWVRNYEVLKPQSLQNQIAQITSAFAQWVSTNKRFDRLIDPLFMLGCALFVFLAVQRRSFKRQLHEMLSQPIRPRDERGLLVIRALFLSALAVLPAPLGLILLGDAVIRTSPGSAFALGVHDCLHIAAFVLMPIDLTLRLSAKLGAGRRVLKWNANKVDALSRDLSWGRVLLIISAAAFVLGNTLSPSLGGGALAILGSGIITVVLLFIVSRMLTSGAFQADKFALIGLRVVAVALIAIALMHGSGQLFAAHQYLTATSMSIVGVLLVIFASNVLKRLLLIQRAALERKVKAEAKLRESNAQTVSENSTDGDDDLEIASSLSDAYEQLLGLFRVLSLGAILWYVWSPALPALAFLDSVTLWTTHDPTEIGSGVYAISLSVFLLALLILGISLLLVKHLPPLVNVILMEWTAVSGGGRYATGMIIQYILIGAGLAISLGMLGFQWSKVQWLVAALGVGIGFGLQEIVANFISGLIVLFERPIRVGDIINAGGHDGTVTQIKARATVVQTFEQKEVMIPNKELITSVVTNWSLSNTQLRVLVPVGIAYGADVRHAMQILIGVANDNPEVLDDPEPLVTFEDFGDNALVLWLRCYANDEYIRVATALRIEIYERFSAAGIGIAFPQRDVHLDAASPIPVRLIAEDAENGA